MAIPIQNTEQKVDKKKYDSNFDKIFGRKPEKAKGKYVMKDGRLIRVK